MKHGLTPKPAGISPGELSVQTSNGYLVVRELGEPLKKRKRMTANKADALGDDAKKWNSINWKKARREIRRLQVSVDSGYAP